MTQPSSPNQAPQLGHIHKGDTQSATNADLIERRNKHFAGSFLFYENPLNLVRGEGVYLYDDRGNSYLDFYNNVQSMGHSNPAIVDAIQRQTAELTTHTRYLNERVIEFAETAASTLPGDLDICLFVCTGTEACELATRIARTVTGNNGLVVMNNSYHGNSKLVTEMSTAYPQVNPPAHIESIEPPNPYRGTYRRTSTTDKQLGERYASLVEPAIANLQERGEDLAAFVCDSVFDSNGAIDVPEDYFQRVASKVREAGGLMIADEVQAGICRTGKFWGFEHFDFVPDIVFTGKPLGSGFPVAAVFTTREIADKWMSQDIYFNTFGGNPVAAAAGKAVLDYAITNDMAGHAKTVGQYLQQQLSKLATQHSIIGNIQGKGLFVCVDLVKDRETLEPASEIAAQIPEAMKQRGVLIGLTGSLGNCLKFRPPLVVSESDIDKAIAALDDTLCELTR